MWETTAGSALAGDDSLAAVLRETMEETGLTLDPAKGQIIPFAENELPSVPEIELTDKYDASQFELTENLGRSFGFGRREDSKQSRERVIKGNK